MMLQSDSRLALSPHLAFHDDSFRSTVDPAHSRTYSHHMLHPYHQDCGLSTWMEAMVERVKVLRLLKQDTHEVISPVNKLPETNINISRNLSLNASRGANNPQFPEIRSQQEYEQASREKQISDERITQLEQELDEKGKKLTKLEKSKESLNLQLKLLQTKLSMLQRDLDHSQQRDNVTRQLEETIQKNLYLSLDAADIEFQASSFDASNFCDDLNNFMLSSNQVLERTMTVMSELLCRMTQQKQALSQCKTEKKLLEDAVQALTNDLNKILSEVKLSYQMGKRQLSAQSKCTHFQEEKSPPTLMKTIDQIKLDLYEWKYKAQCAGRQWNVECGLSLSKKNSCKSSIVKKSLESPSDQALQMNHLQDEITLLRGKLSSMREKHRQLEADYDALRAKKQSGVIAARWSYGSFPCHTISPQRKTLLSSQRSLSNIENDASLKLGNQEPANSKLGENYASSRSDSAPKADSRSKKSFPTVNGDLFTERRCCEMYENPRSSREGSDSEDSLIMLAAGAMSSKDCSKEFTRR